MLDEFMKYFDKIDWKMCTPKIGYNILNNKEYTKYWELMWEFETKKKNIFNK